MARRVLLTCATMSVVAHAMAVTMWMPLERPARISAANTTQTWRVRQVPIEPVVNPAVPKGTQASHEEDHASRVDSPANTPSIENADVALIGDEASMGPITSEPAPQSEIAEPSQENSAYASLEGDYIPRPQLTQPPVSLAPVMIAPPEGNHETGRIVGILSLFINEQGGVDRVLSTGPNLPPAFEQNAIAAFKNIRFNPGQLDGMPVKSRIRIEVIFDNTPIEPADGIPVHR